MGGLASYLCENAVGGLLPWRVQEEAARKFGVTLGAVEEAALCAGILPSRYQRNRSTLSVSDQLVLRRSRVAVIGCGGLGGYIVEQLARVGVGEIVAVDPDRFEEHNLNRQLLSTTENLGALKAEAAVKRAAAVNPAVTVFPVTEAFDQKNGYGILSGCSLALDALDNIKGRLELASVCSDMSIPLVHGAICGWYGQVATQMPGHNTLEKVYGNSQGNKGLETRMGNPAFTPAVVASIQVAEAVKVLLKKDGILAGRVLHINLLDMDVETFTI